MSSTTHIERGDESERQRAVLAELFRDHFDAVFGFCLVRTGSRSLAEEVASDTFSDAVRHVRSGNTAITSGWLITVARRRLIDHWRASSREQRRIARAGMEREPVESAAIGLSDERVLSAIDSLPERQRAALTLRYLDEMSVTETAEALDLSYSATESLVARARRNFLDAYERTGSS